MTSTVAVTFDATAVVGAVVDFVMETSPKNSDFPRESTCITIRTHLSCAHNTSDLKRKRKEKFSLFSDHNGSLLRRQPGGS